MGTRYIVELDDAEREILEQMQRGGSCGVRRLKRAQILGAARRIGEINPRSGAGCEYRSGSEFNAAGVSAWEVEFG